MKVLSRLGYLPCLCYADFEHCGHCVSRHDQRPTFSIQAMVHGDAQEDRRRFGGGSWI